MAALVPASADSVAVEKRGGAPVAAAAGQSADTDHIRFRVSNEDEDHFGDVVVQAGLEFPRALPAVADHSHTLDAALGDWHSIERAGRETFATLRLLPRGVSRSADLVRALHEGGFPLASSIYFTSKLSDVEPILKSGPAGRQIQTGQRYRRGKVQEITLTQFPANAAAVAVARSLGFNDAELAALSRPEPARVPVARSNPAVAAANPQRSTTMTLAELIAAAQTAFETAQATLNTATQALEADQSEANITAVQRATTEVEQLFTRLGVLRSAETAAARRAAGAAAPAPAAATTAVSRAVAAVSGAPGAPAVNSRRTDTKDVKPGTHLARLVIARSVAFDTKEQLDVVTQRMFPHEPEVIAIARTAVGVADTTTAGWASELVRTETRAMLDEDLRPMSIWARLASLGTSLNFGGAASVVVPNLNVGQTQDGAWVGEGGAIPLVKGGMTAKRLYRYKLGGIIPITKELQRTSDPSAVEVMRRLLLRVISNLLDGSLISANAAVQGVRPDGIMVGVVPLTGTAGGGMNAVTEDIKALIGAFITANVGAKPVLIVNSATLLSLGLMTNALGEFVFRSEVAGGMLLTIPIIGSPMVPADRVICVDAAYFASAIDEAEIDISETATVVLANSDVTAPTHATGAAGAIGTAHEVPPDGGIPVSGGAGAAAAGAQAISFWQTWSLGIRLVLPASFGMTRGGAVQAVDGITW